MKIQGRIAMAKLYPLFANLESRRVVVIGGGKIAERKVTSLLDCGAAVHVVSPDLTERLTELLEQKRFTYEPRVYRMGDLAGASLVIAACGDRRVGAMIFTEANQRGVFCNVVDETPLCSFQVPAVVSRGPLQIAVSTSGTSPAEARRIRQQLEEQFDDNYVVYLDALGRLRERLKLVYPGDQKRRAEKLEAFADAGALKMLREGKAEEFDRLLHEYMQ